MMNRHILILLAALFLVTACTKEGIIRRKEDKLTGAWEFEKVFYKRDNALFRDNITDEYANDIVEFFSDYSAIYDDASLRSVFDGEWSLIVDEDFDDLEFFVDAVFFDFVNREDFFMFGSIDKLNRNKLNLEASDNRGTFTFKLRRL